MVVRGMVVRRMVVRRMVVRRMVGVPRYLMVVRQTIKINIVFNNIPLLKKIIYKMKF
jgi:hypothetical protein